MQPLDSITTQHLAADLNELLSGLRINRLQQPSERTLLWQLGGWQTKAPEVAERYKPCRLLLSWPATAGFCALLPPEPLQALGLQAEASSQKKPLPLLGLLRKFLQGARVAGVSSVPGEPILLFHLQALNELGEKRPLCFVLELTGKYANALLVETPKPEQAFNEAPEGGKILALAHSVMPWMSQHRPLRTGGLYSLPPTPAHKTLLADVTPAQWQTWLQESGVTTPSAALKLLGSKAWGLSRHQAQQWVELQAEAGQGEAPTAEGLLAFCQSLLQAESIKPVACLPEAFSAEHPAYAGYRLVSLAPDDERPFASVHELVAAYYSELVLFEQLKQHRQTLLSLLKQRRKGLQRQVGALKFTSAEQLERLQAQGDALFTLYSQGELPSYVESPFWLTLPEEETPQAVELDVRLDWPGNGQRLYKLAKKGRRRNELEAERQASLESQLLYVEELEALVLQASSLQELQTLQGEVNLAAQKPHLKNKKADKAKKAEQSKSKAKQAKPGSPAVLKLQSQDPTTGELWPIWVGKSAEANAALCGRLASAQDWWLHAQERPGSHVLLKRSDAKTPVPPSVLEDALHVAGWFSSSRGSANIPIVVCESRYVRKIPNSWPGHVTYRNEEGYFITPDEERVSSLLKPT